MSASRSKCCSVATHDRWRPDVVLVVVDAVHLERNLFLASQVLELGIPVVIALNQFDVAEQEGIRIDVPELIHELGVPVVPTVAMRGEGLEPVKRALITATALPSPVAAIRVAGGGGRGARAARPVPGGRRIAGGGGTHGGDAPAGRGPSRSARVRRPRHRAGHPWRGGVARARRIRPGPLRGRGTLRLDRARGRAQRHATRQRHDHVQ